MIFYAFQAHVRVEDKKSKILLCLFSHCAHLWKKMGRSFITVCFGQSLHLFLCTYISSYSQNAILLTLFWYQKLCLSIWHKHNFSFSAKVSGLSPNNVSYFLEMSPTLNVSAFNLQLTTMLFVCDRKRLKQKWNKSPEILFLLKRFN